MNRLRLRTSIFQMSCGVLFVGLCACGSSTTSTAGEETLAQENLVEELVLEADAGMEPNNDNAGKDGFSDEGAAVESTEVIVEFFLDECEPKQDGEVIGGDLGDGGEGGAADLGQEGVDSREEGGGEEINSVQTLRIVEVLSRPNHLAASYLEIQNVSELGIDTSRYWLRVNDTTDQPLPTKILEPGKRLLLATGEGIPGGAVILEGLVIPQNEGRLALLDSNGTEIDSVRWNPDEPVGGESLGIAMERIDPLAPGEDLHNWQSAPALISAAQIPLDWAKDRGSPGRPRFDALEGAALTGNTEVSQNLGNLTDLVRHPLTADAGTWLALEVDVDRVAGYATATFFALDLANLEALSPLFFTTSLGDSYAVLEIIDGQSQNIEVRVWADPIEIFEPTYYLARAVPPSRIVATPPSLTLMPGETAGLTVDVLFEPLEIDGQVFSIPLSADRVTFESLDQAIALVDTTGQVLGISTGNTSILVRFEQPDGPREVEVPVIVGSITNNGETCQSAIDVTQGGIFTNQSILGANNDYDAAGDGCPFAITDGDRVYLLNPSEDHFYRVRVEPVGSFDPMLYAMRDCVSQDCIAGTVLNGPGEPESISFQAFVGMPVYVVVDGEAMSEGNYSLQIEILSAK